MLQQTSQVSRLVYIRLGMDWVFHGLEKEPPETKLTAHYRRPEAFFGLARYGTVLIMEFHPPPDTPKSPLWVICLAIISRGETSPVSKRISGCLGYDFPIEVFQECFLKWVLTVFTEMDNLSAISWLLATAGDQAQ